MKELSAQEFIDLIVERRLEIVGQFCTDIPSSNLIFRKCTPDEVILPLQDWIGLNLKEENDYMTAISIIEAAWQISVSDFENGTADHKLSPEAKAIFYEIT